MSILTKLDNIISYCDDLKGMAVELKVELNLKSKVKVTKVSDKQRQDVCNKRLKNLKVAS